MKRIIHITLQVLNILDFVYTYYFVIYEKTWVEVNFVPAWLIGKFGVGGLFFCKVVTACVLWWFFCLRWDKKVNKK